MSSEITIIGLFQLCVCQGRNVTVVDKTSHTVDCIAIHRATLRSADALQSCLAVLLENFRDISGEVEAEKLLKSKLRGKVGEEFLCFFPVGSISAF